MIRVRITLTEDSFPSVVALINTVNAEEFYGAPPGTVLLYAVEVADGAAELHFMRTQPPDAVHTDWSVLEKLIDPGILPRIV